MSTLFFDLDDTLLDTTGMMIESVQAVAARFHSRLSPSQFIQLPDVYLRANLDAWQGARPADPRFSLESIWHRCWTQAAAELAIDISVVEIVATYREARASVRTRLFPEAIAVLLALTARGHRLGLISNGPPAVQRVKLADTGLDRLLDPIVISQEVGHAKPDPRIFHAAARRAGSDAASCAMIGDLLFADIAGGRASGWRTVWVRRVRDIGPAHDDPRSRAESERPHDVVSDLEGLLDLF